LSDGFECGPSCGDTSGLAVAENLHMDCQAGTQRTASSETWDAFLAGNSLEWAFDQPNINWTYTPGISDPRQVFWTDLDPMDLEVESVRHFWDGDLSELGGECEVVQIGTFYGAQACMNYEEGCSNGRPVSLDMHSRTLACSCRRLVELGYMYCLGTGFSWDLFSPCSPCRPVLSMCKLKCVD
jgi:hypothetical protein